MTLRLPGLQEASQYVGRIRRQPPSGTTPGGAALTGPTRSITISRPDKASAAIRLFY
ncbi:hypothetical protein HMPREF3207_04885 [Citrobacter koseri]|nr:hypothetical protein HMPREF3207_04885 [Citrobacter koseri]